LAKPLGTLDDICLPSPALAERIQMAHGIDPIQGEQTATPQNCAVKMAEGLTEDFSGCAADVGDSCQGCAGSELVETCAVM
jgi:nicotinamide mononucleotide (NMN) deamidase PncC